MGAVRASLQGRGASYGALHVRVPVPLLKAAQELPAEVRVLQIRLRAGQEARVLFQWIARR
jgi:hypothetical protein